MSKKLNGLPHNLVSSYFGTARSGKDTFVLRYYDGGYMADWLSNAAQKYKIKTASFDIKNCTAIPLELNIHPLISNLQDLSAVIANELSANNFSPDFIKEAKMDVIFRPNSRIFQVIATVVDKDGNSYVSDPKLEEGLEPYFDIDMKLSKSHRKQSKKSFWRRLWGLLG